jgi:hypothetical protein
MTKAEPPSPQSSPCSSLFRIGKDSHGHWVVQDQQGLRGGLFVDRAEALKFAMFENGNRPQAVIMVPGVLELDMIGRPQTVRRVATKTESPLRRVA